MLAIFLSHLQSKKYIDNMSRQYVLFFKYMAVAISAPTP